MDVGGTEPKKYIRTFAGDMETFQGGGTPDLAPLEEQEKPSPAERLIESSPAISTPPVPPAQPQMPARAFIQKTILPPVQLQQQYKPQVPIAIKTYEGDFSDKVKETHAAPATILAAEQDAAPNMAKVMSALPIPEQKKPTLMIVGGAVLVLLGIVGVFFAYEHYSSITNVILAPTIPSPIFVEEKQPISGDSTTLIRGMEQSVSHSLTNGTVRLLYTESATSTNNNVFAAMFKNQASDILLRNLNTSGNMSGIVNIGGNQSPFFILSVTSYNDTFAGMLSWEPLMPHDLALLFPAYPEQTAQNTPDIPDWMKAPFSPKSPSVVFQDDVIDNHDVRVFKDSKGRTILLYGYWDQNTLVIARDNAAFSEIVRRLSVAHKQ